MFDLNLNDNHRTPAFKVQITTKDKKTARHHTSNFEPFN